MRQAVIYFKDGTKDWIDPLDRLPVYTETEIEISNGVYTYTFIRDLVNRVEIIEVEEAK